MKREFNGTLLGSLEEVYGEQISVKLDDRFIDSFNITLIINNEHRLLCSSRLSEIIRKRDLIHNLDVLKKYSVFTFENKRTFIISSTMSNKILEKNERIRKVNEIFMEFFEDYLEIIKNHKSSNEELLKWNKEYENLKAFRSIEINKIESEFE